MGLSDIGVNEHLPATAFKTYQIAAPVASHFRPASCEEAGCLNYHNGWITKVPLGSDLEDLVKQSGRHWTLRDQVGAEVAYHFPAGTTCFNVSTHKVPLERPALFVVRDGDHRGNPSGRVYRHTRPADWVEDFAEHQDGVATARNQG